MSMTYDNARETYIYLFYFTFEIFLCLGQRRSFPFFCCSSEDLRFISVNNIRNKVLQPYSFNSDDVKNCYMRTDAEDTSLDYNSTTELTTNSTFIHIRSSATSDTSSPARTSTRTKTISLTTSQRTET